MRKRDMVTMQMTEYDIRGLAQCVNDSLAHPCSNNDLTRMGQQAMTKITQSKARINDDSTLSRRHHAAKAANAKGFRTYNFDCHSPVA